MFWLSLEGFYRDREILGRDRVGHDKEFLGRDRAGRAKASAHG